MPVRSRGRRPVGICAGIGAQVEFQTKPELALQMVTRALDADVPAGWVAGDEVYGQHAGLRLALEDRGMAYVLAVPVNRHVIAAVDGQPGDARVDALSAAVPRRAVAAVVGGRRRQGRSSAARR